MLVRARFHPDLIIDILTIQVGQLTVRLGT
jgi:hypothetical protein